MASLGQALAAQSRSTSENPERQEGYDESSPRTIAGDGTGLPSNDDPNQAANPNDLTPLHRDSSPAEADPLPDGGFKAWLQVVISHLVNVNTFGYMLSYGIFQGYYTHTFGYSASQISWVGTMELFLVFFLGAFSGRALDLGYYRHTLVVGLTLQLLGVFMTSLSTRFWQLFLAQGICQGIGNGLLFCPAVALVSTYFSPEKRALAISFVACGGATGGMAFPAIAQAPLQRLGFAWTVRVMGLVMLFNSALILAFSRTRLPPRKAGPWIDWEAFHELPYVLFCAGMFLGFWGLYFAYYYVRPFGQDVLHVSGRTSFDLLLVINSFGIPGRIFPALLADRYVGPVNVIVPFILVTGVLLYCWITVASVYGIYIWVAAYGFFGGGCQSLYQAASCSFTLDSRKVGARIGMVSTIVSFACLSGAPIAGVLVEYCDGKYIAAQIFGGSVMVCGSVLLLGGRLAQTGPHLRRRV